MVRLLQRLRARMWSDLFQSKLRPPQIKTVIKKEVRFCERMRCVLCQNRFWDVSLPKSQAGPSHWGRKRYHPLQEPWMKSLKLHTIISLRGQKQFPDDASLRWYHRFIRHLTTATPASNTFIIVLDEGVIYI